MNQQRDKYQAYLKTFEWRVKRAKVLKRDNYLCQSCLENKATEVHHLSYRDIYEEHCFQLTSLCHACHERYHKK